MFNRHPRSKPRLANTIFPRLRRRSSTYRRRVRIVNYTLRQIEGSRRLLRHKDPEPLVAALEYRQKKEADKIHHQIEVRTTVLRAIQTGRRTRVRRKEIRPAPRK